MSLPTPYFHDERAGITIYNGDAKALLPLLHADAVVTDAPFGIADAPIHQGVRSGSGVRRGRDNDWHEPSEWDRELDPALMPACLAAAPVVAWFGHWNKRELVERHAGIKARAEIVWAKDMHCGPPCPVARQDERIWLFSASGITCKRFDTSVWHEPVIPTWRKKLHKNEKPLALMKRLVLLLAEAGELIIDPFMGSGTTIVAAKDLGVRAIGIDLKETNCANAVARLRQEVLLA